MKNRPKIDLMHFYPHLQFILCKLDSLAFSSNYLELKPYLPFGEPINSVKASMDLGYSETTIYRHRRKINKSCAIIINDLEEILSNFR